VGALAQIDGWDVGAAAAAIVTPTDVVEAHGPVDAPFALASVSKVLASVTVHIAVEEGSITLDDAAGPPGSTVRHLLAHASGLPPDGDATPLGPPERKRIYSNVGFEVLGEHVAERTGMPFEEYARLALVEPLGLASTDVSGSPAHAHSSTVDDLCRVLQAVVGGELLAAASIEAMTEPAFPDLAGVLPGFGAQNPNPWGLGVEVRGHKAPHWTAPSNTPGTWGHFGRAGTFVWWDPMVELGLVVLTDREFGPWAAEAWPRLASAVLSRRD
jgi:CubicO group peptidase (beta-lactamase class C family)